MSHSLIPVATKLFEADPAKWEAFLELAPLKDKIAEHWFAKASTELRARCAGASDQWVMKEWEWVVDTCWYLKEFGNKSIGIGWGWTYEFHLYLFEENPDKADRARGELKKDQYALIRDQFTRRDEHSDMRFAGHSLLMERRCFDFGTDHGSPFPELELAWYAGNEPKFVEQALAKVTAFTENDEVTALMRKLNEAVQ